MVEILGTVTLVSALSGLYMLQMQNDRRAYEQQQAAADLETARNWLERARHGQLPELPNGWTFDLHECANGFESVVVSWNGQSLMTFRKRP